MELDINALQLLQEPAPELGLAAYPCAGGTCSIETKCTWW